MLLSQSVVIYIPHFDLIFKQLNEASRKVVHFTGRSQFSSKHLQNSNKVEILLVCGINYSNFTLTFETRLCFAGDTISYPSYIYGMMYDFEGLCSLTFYSCNMGMSDLPHKYAQSPRAAGIHIRQITCAHVTAIM